MIKRRYGALLMTGSAVFLAGAGLACLFLPEDVARALGHPTASAGFSLAAAGLLGFAAVNWLGRGAIYGGIYGRPIVVGNLAFGSIAALTLARAQLSDPYPGGLVATGVFAVYAALFGWLMLRPPFPARGD